MTPFSVLWLRMWLLLHHVGASPVSGVAVPPPLGLAP